MSTSRIVTAVVLLVTVLAVPAVTAATPAPAATAAPFDQTTAETPCASDPSYPVTVTDATGTELTIEQSPDSVVALAPSDARTIYRIGAEDRLVGLPYMKATERLDRGDRANIGTGFEINQERIIELDPDVVLAANITSTEDIEQLRAANITVYHFAAAESLADVRENVRLTGLLVGDCEGATETVEWMDSRLQIVERALEDVDRPLAYYELGDGYTTGSDTFQHDVLQTAGLENVGARVGLGGWAQINTELLIAEDPQWIVYPDRTDEPAVPDAATSMTAYQNRQFVPVDENNVSQPAPQVVYAVEEIVRTVHPEAYQAALDSEQSSGNETESNDTTASDQDTGSGAETDESTDSVPGFGPLVAITAVFTSLGLLARRR